MHKINKACYTIMNRKPTNTSCMYIVHKIMTIYITWIDRYIIPLTYTNILIHVVSIINYVGPTYIILHVTVKEVSSATSITFRLVYNFV